MGVFWGVINMEDTATELLPDRPISRWLVPLRSLLRMLRLMKQKTFLRGKFFFGKNVNFGSHVNLRPPRSVRVGNNVYIGSWFVSETNLEIGSDVLISSRVACVGNDHSFDDPKRTVFNAGRLRPCTVILEGNNLIGFGTIIVGNVRIGKGCIVGAGSVVTRDLPPDTVCVGVPARPIRDRYQRKI